MTPGSSLVEHATESQAIDGDRLNSKTDDPAGKLIHDQQDPVRIEQDRFDPEQVDAPQTVFGLS